MIRAIDRGVKYLLEQEDKTTLWEGFWPEDKKAHTSGKTAFPRQFGGETALVTEALLDVGQSLHIPALNIYAPPLRRAIHFLAGLHPQSTYVASFQANAMALLPAKPQYVRVLQTDARYLQRAMNRDGAYTYWIIPRYVGFGHRPNLWDNSNSQYGVLGVWACGHQGIAIPRRYWVRAADHWRRTQSFSGAWGYSGSKPIRRARTPWRAADFTPAGLASLLICDEFIHQQPRLNPQPDPNVLRGMAWINRHFTGKIRSLYEIYNYVRLGLACGLQTFARHNWYDDFAEHLVKKQRRNGSWKGHFIGADRNVSTAYALLTLDRGLNPILLSKLQYNKSDAGVWNARPRDAANFISWISRTFETPLNWQVVSFNTPVSDWLNSPLLLITGDADPHFSPGDIAELRQYLHAGGIILASCDGRSAVFQKAMIHYARQTVHQRYPVKPLAAASMLYHIQPWLHFRRNPGLLAMSNGVRYLWIISPLDLGGVWQARQLNRKRDWEIPANLYFYANGKGALSNRLHSLVVAPPTGAIKRRLSVAQIKYAGHWNLEPGAWPRMAALAARANRLGVRLARVVPAQLHAANCDLAVMTGTGHFTFRSPQIAALGRYLRHGGMLLGDAAGGKPAFTDSFVKLIRIIFPHVPLVSIPLNASLLMGKFPGGTNVTRVKYRKFVTAVDGLQTHPHLLGIKWHGRWVVVYSQYDMTSGFLGTNTWGIRGYAPASSQALATNVMLYDWAQRHARH
ncbi:MAG: DUF4159 domain-containing protein [Phycisphaerae bacterium]|nr:DUF4159 domain-containing protein [Phycisphaerae bacterium]